MNLQVCSPTMILTVSNFYCSLILKEGQKFKKHIIKKRFKCICVSLNGIRKT